MTNPARHWAHGRFIIEGNNAWEEGIMSRLTNTARLSVIIISTALIGAGCSMFRATVKNEDVATASAVPLNTGYDFADLRWLGETVAGDLMVSPLLEGKPIMVVMGIENRTDEHIDTKAITDSIRTKLINAGKASFVNESQRDNLLKEQGFQLANCTPETRTLVGKQLGARYMLTGSLIKIKRESPREVRMSKQEQVYFQLTAEVTDLQTGLIAWTAQKERVRGASRPILGW
jgi:penicillin-binding protein activator